MFPSYENFPGPYQCIVFFEIHLISLFAHSCEVAMIQNPDFIKIALNVVILVKRRWSLFALYQYQSSNRPFNFIAMNIGCRQSS